MTRKPAKATTTPESVVPLEECRSKGITPDQCPIRNVLARTGDKWTTLVLATLGARSRRFGELRRAVPDISQAMLTMTLRHLQRDGLVSRHVHPTVPPSVEYRLTDLGRSLLVPLGYLMRWAEDHHDAIRTARAIYDVDSDNR